MTTKYIYLTHQPPLQNVNRYHYDGESDSPCVGATGTIIHERQYKVVVEWDRDNPLVAPDQDTNFVQHSNYKIIDEDEFKSFKFTKDFRYIKPYILEKFNVKIKHSNVKVETHKNYNNYFISPLRSKNTLFLGCKFFDSHFLTSDLDSIYFINCVFYNTKRFDMAEFKNATFVNCLGIDNPNDIPEAE